MARKVGIIAYGEESDRQKLEILALLSKGSSSSWVINTIRSQYAEVYGEAKPEDVLDDRRKQRRAPAKP